MEAERTPFLDSWRGAVVFVVVCQLVGIVGAATTGTGTTPWYAELNKPSFQPPSWLFGPVWTVLYALMGLAAWRVWIRRAGNAAARVALGLFTAQLLLNAIWTPVFFGAHAIAAALAILIALDVVLLATIVAFARVDRVAAWMLAPYLAWVGFATVLGAAIVQLN